MVNTGKKLLVVCAVVIFGMVVALLMKNSALGIEGAGDTFQKLAIKMALGRVVIVGCVMLFAWEYLCKKIYGYFHVDISLIRYRILGWYLAAEAVVISSLYGL